MRRIIWLSLMLLMGVAARSQTWHRLDGTTVRAAEADALVQRMMAEHRVLGAGLAVLEHGRVVYLRGFGMRETGRGLPMTPDTVMTAASLTKATFATMVMQLVGEGTLDLDTPVMGYLTRPLSEYADWADLAADPRAGAITLRMLLSHTSGLPNLRRFTADGKLHLLFAPGTRYAYSGEGMKLAQFLVEQVRGKSLAELMRERVFEPLAMGRTSMVWEGRFAEDVATRYDEDGKSLGQERRKRADAAGSMETTVRDMGALLAGVLSGRALPAAARETMLRPAVRIPWRTQFPTFTTERTTANDGIELGYGLGWGVFQTRYGRGFFKEGHDDGWRHYMVGFDRVGSGMVVMTNSSNGEDLLDPLLRGLLGDGFTPLEWEGYRAEASK